ncbi:MAG: WD40 repeat domain-containing protein, partial [Cyanobacteria bacterium J06607_17]
LRISSPASTTLVSGSADHTIKLWDLEALSLDSLVVSGCEWLRYHVAHNPVKISDDDLALCDGIGTEL